MIQFAYLLGGEGVWRVLTDPSHLLAELVLMGIVDGLIGALAWPLFRRWLHRHDEQEHPQGASYETQRLHTRTLAGQEQRLQALEARASHQTDEQ